MNAADGYVMSSAWEGMPGVLLEASATALPIVSTNVSGSCEIVLDHLSGFLVPTRNPEQLAQSMMSVMSLSSSEQTRMGSLGRSHVLNHFSLDKGVETWEKLYLDLIQQKCSGSFNDIGQRMHKK
jgi:glycosyltransferase involved in cell wall biosynthesis